MNSLDLIASLQRYWGIHGPSDLPVVFPGTRRNVTSEPLWMELWVTQLREPERRWTGPRSFECVIDIHLFGQGSDPRAVFAASDQVADTLRSRVLTVTTTTADESEDATVGSLRLLEPQLVDLSRQASQGQSIPLQHLLLSIAAVAEKRLS